MTEIARVVKNKELSLLFCRYFLALEQPECISLGRKQRMDFTRKREMTFAKLIAFLIFRNGKHSNQDLTHFYSSLNQLHRRISKQALFKALRKVNPRVFRYLIQKFTQLFYQSDLVKTYRSYLLLAEDGSCMDAPLSNESMDRFGFQVNQVIKEKKDVKTVVAKMGGLFDITNGFFASVTVKGKSDSEITLAYENIQHSLTFYKNRKAIYLAGRYYGGIELFQTLQMNKLNFCIRGKTYFYKDAVATIEKDGWITLSMTETWLNRIKNQEVRDYMRSQEKITVRVVKHSLETPNDKGETHHLYFTNLTENEFTSDEIVDLYRFRWDIETNYRFFKVDLEAERFNTHDCDVYMCKLLSKIILLNFVGVLKAEVNEQLAVQSTKKHQEGFKTKFNCLKYAICESRLLVAITTCNITLSKKVLKEILLAAFKNKVPIRNDRHFTRYGRFMKSTSNYRFTLDGRNKPNVRRTSCGLRTVRP